MRVKVVQVVWHNKEPVFSADFHASGVLATGGSDGEIKLWKVDTAGDGLGATYLSSVTGDSYDTGFRAWNVVRFCPKGHCLAAAGDQGQICVFRPPEGNPEGSTVPWKAQRMGAFSSAEVVDLCWAADGSGFITASHDLTCMFWDPDARMGNAKLRLEGHKLYVQGVAWDPLHQYVVTQGADRCCRVYSIPAAVPVAKQKQKAEVRPAITRLDGLFCSHVINKRAQLATAVEPPSEAGNDAPDGRAGRRSFAQNLFYDESAEIFFRRLCWSPDGSMLVAPAGLCRTGEAAAQLNVAYVFARGAWKTPLMQLPATKPVVAARFCPVLFERGPKHSNSTSLPIDLPYKMVFAVATKDSVVIYDTQSSAPLAVLGNLHPEQLTDLAWSPDGLTLVVSSYDSYCSVACFDEGELGDRIEPEQIPNHVHNILWSTISSAETAAPSSASKPAVQVTSQCPEPDLTAAAPRPGRPAEGTDLRAARDQTEHSVAPKAGTKQPRRILATPVAPNAAASQAMPANIAAETKGRQGCIDSPCLPARSTDHTATGGRGDGACDPLPARSAEVVNGQPSTEGGRVAGLSIAEMAAAAGISASADE